MKAREWYDVYDKSGWGDGPWQKEPDKAQWLDEATRLPCLAVRNNVSGTLCGYVGVPPGHRVRHALFESSHQLEETTLKAVERATVAVAEEKARKIKDPQYKKIIIGGARLKVMNQRLWRNVYDRVEAYLSVHGGVTYAGAGVGDVGRSVFQQMRVTLLKRQAQAVGYPRGDAQRWIDEWQPLLGDYDRWLEHIHATSLAVLPEPGDPKPLRYVGFDTAHSGDVMPAMSKLYSDIGLKDLTKGHKKLYSDLKELGAGDWGEVYRDLDYVKAQCAELAVQLQALGPRRTWKANY